MGHKKHLYSQNNKKMRIKIILFFLIISLLSCKDKKEKLTETLNNQIQKSELKENTNNKFNFDSFLISKGQIGQIKIGMNIIDAQKLLSQMNKKEVEAYDFGFDGGGKAYIYSLENEPILSLIPKRDSQEILAIIAINQKLKTNNGLNPKSSIIEILKKYPEMDINQDLMMGWEFMHQESNNWDFVFMTEENKRIGEYNEIESPTKPKIITTKMDWITIK